MAKILMVNLPYAGHTNPTLPLAQELAARGHQVGYINDPEWRDRIEQTGAIFHPFLDYPINPTEQEKKTRSFWAAYQTAMAVGDGYDLLVYEMLFYPGRVIAERLGIPCVRQFSQPAWNEASYAAMRKTAPLFEISCRLIDRQVMGHKTALAMGMKGSRLMDAVLHDKVPLNIVYLPESFQPLREAFDDSYLFVGPPAVYEPEANIPSGIDELPRPLIYISMGSIMSSRIFCRRCLKAFGGKSLSVILTTGRVPPAALEPVPENIQALSFAPQMEILGRADLFVTHGGMNSVNEAMYQGVPMLVLPVLNDQPINAAQVERLGIGRRMRAFPTTAHTLYRNTMAALANPAIRQAAAHVRVQMRRQPGAKAAADALERLL